MLTFIHLSRDWDSGNVFAWYFNMPECLERMCFSIISISIHDLFSLWMTGSIQVFLIVKQIRRGRSRMGHIMSQTGRPVRDVPDGTSCPKRDVPDGTSYSRCPDQDVPSWSGRPIRDIICPILLLPLRKQRMWDSFHWLVPIVKMY